MKSYAFGVDLGGTTVKIGLFRTDGELVYRHEIPTRKEKDGAYILGDIAKAVRISRTGRSAWTNWKASGSIFRAR